MTEKTVDVPEKISGATAKKIAVFNKLDLTSEKPGIPAGFDRVVYISAKTGEGEEDLEKAVAELFPLSETAAESEMPANIRQFECLVAAKNELEHAVENIGITPDALLCDIEGAIGALGEMTGKTVSEEIIENIFSRFCVGK
jgi:tRNA modification GTPase